MRLRDLSLCLVVLACATQVRAQTPPPTIGVLVDQVVALFPRLDGDVIEVQGDTITVALGRKDGAVTGVGLTLYRQGRELRHPRTGEILGHTEQDVGRMVIHDVFEAYSTGTASPGASAQPGDRARVSAGKVKLTVLSLPERQGKQDQAEAAAQELIESLNRTGRFQIGMGDSINVWLSQQQITRQDVLDGKGLDRIAEQSKVDNLLVVAFSRVQAKPYMDVRLFAFPGHSPLLTTALFVPASIKRPAKGDFSASGKQRESQTPQRSLLARLLFGELDAGAYSSGESTIPLKEVAKFPFVVQSMDIAVSSKDKVPRIVLTDGDQVFLYRITPERVLEPEWTYPASSRGRIFSVQLAELTGDGTLHVVVNRYSPITGILLTSFVLVSRNGRPAVAVEDVSDILLAVDADGDGFKKTLWAQPFSDTSFFKQGDAVRVSIKDGKLVSEGRVRVPNSFRATGATFSNIAGKGSRALAFIDEYHRLRIAVDAEDVFRSSTGVGGGIPKLEVITKVERGGRSYVYTAEPTPLAVDLDGDGVEEIVVPQNELPGRLAVIYKGPAGYRFQTVNSGFEGQVAALGAIPGDGTPTLVAAVVRFTNMLKTQGETQIIMTTTE